MDVNLSLVTLSVLPVLIYGTFLFRKKVRETYRDVRLHLARLNAYMQEHITGMNIIQIFNKEKDELKRFSSINNDYRIANIKSIFYYALFYRVELLVHCDS
jgi:ATP-binding cassette subfamily B protein